jgi:predicted metalloprotease
MQWFPGDRSNVEDLRGRSGFGGMKLGIGSFLLLLVLSWATGTNLFSLLGDGTSTSGPNVATGGQVQSTPAEERQVDFVDAVMKDVQDTWAQQLGPRYERTRVGLFRDTLRSGCGLAQSATGPFYCPADREVYLDLGFFDELSRRFGAPGDFARAYVIAHEVGHHVQNLLGLTERLAAQNRATGANGASVAIELQADCFAGVWGHAASEPGRAKAGRIELDPGDVEQGLRAAAAIGDDRLQKMTTGHVMPDRFTHGTSAQRVAWFQRGMSSGDARACDTTATQTR